MTIAQIDIIRRSADRGLAMAHAHGGDDLKYVDIFTHILDELFRLKKQLLGLGE